MRFTTALSALAAFTLATANSIQFVNQDATTRTIVITASEGFAEIQPVTVPGYGSRTVRFPEGWIGNAYSVSAGEPDVPGMLAEVAFDGWVGDTYFDVSAIVNPDDVNGVKKLFPKVSQAPLSGCETFPCANAYNLPDDIQTLSTPEKDLVCLIGNASGSQYRRHARDFVTAQ